jgi:sugar lactone lactonase YvrE
VPVIDRARIAEALPGLELGRECGSGVFGLVLAAHQSDPGRDIAVKVLEYVGNTEQVGEPAPDTFTRLDHPHVAETYSVTTAGPLRLVVTEFLPGGSLAGRRDLSGPAACALALAIARGLAAAHAAGVLHGDVTPANILFTAGGRPKLTDLGVATLAGYGRDSADQVVGNPQYLAPEQIGGGELSPATDVYGLAATLYELLAGERLFGAALTVPDRLRHHCEVVPPPPAGAPAAVAAVIARALAKAPTDRYQSAAAFADQLAEAASADFGPLWLTPFGTPVELPSASTPPATAEAAAVAEDATLPVTEDAALPVAEDATLPVTEDDGNLPATEADLTLPVTDDRTLAVTDDLTFPVTEEDRTLPATEADLTLGLPAGPRGPADPSAGTMTRALTEPGPTTAPPGPPRATAPSTHADGDPPAAKPAARRRRRAALPLLAGAAAAVLAAAVVLPIRLTRDDATAALAPAGPTSPPGPASASGSPPAPPPLPRLSIAAVAGNGTAGYSGDGGPATAAQLASDSYGLARDTAGDLFIADGDNNVVRRVSPDGTITTVAGDGKAGFSGDGGPATAAQLNEPLGLAVDRAGNLYIADWGNLRIRRVGPDGLITTIAGNGQLDHPPSYRADPADIVSPTAADVGDGGPATSAELTPSGLTLDRAGGLLVADSMHQRIRRISPTGIITTIAGVDGEGSFGDGGPATDALLDYPHDVTVDRQGRVYIAEQSGQRVRRIDPDGTIETMAGTGTAGFSGDGGPATAATLRDPRGVAVDDAGDVFIDDVVNNRIREVTAAGTIVTVAGTQPPGGAPTSGPLPSGLYPDGPMIVDPTGHVLYVTDRKHNRILRLDLGGS